MYKYTLTKMEGSSEKYGACEVCGKPVDSVFNQGERQSYISDNGGGAEILYTTKGCHNLFGHVNCLINERKQ